MEQSYGLYHTTLNRWMMNGNSILFYPQKEIAEAHLLMLGRDWKDFTVKQFGQTYKKNNK